jgi:XTP/dITP diphosphohydrolase
LPGSWINAESTANMRLLIATSNPGKIREFREMLGSDRYQWHDLRDVGPIQGVEETGATFADNAALKAAYYARATGMWALADDSGLEVDALGGRPGVHSARWAELNGAGRGDADNNTLLLRQLEAIPDEQRTGRFVCTLALSDPNGIIALTARDTVEGRILRAPRGDHGFGYDPLFYFPDLGCTTAELPSAQKHQISHRGKALRRMRQLMEQQMLPAETTERQPNP